MFHPEDDDSGDLASSFATISKHGRPVVVATANRQDVPLVNTRGGFPWHRHGDADEVFVCWRGVFRVESRDRIVELRPGQLVAVPRGIEGAIAARSGGRPRDAPRVVW